MGNALDVVYDELYDRFDGIMRNVRTNIYMREYKREYGELTRLAAKRGVATDENVLHELPRRFCGSEAGGLYDLRLSAHRAGESDPRLRSLHACHPRLPHLLGG